MNGRRRAIAVVAGTSLLSIAAGFAAATRVVPPAESAARSAANSAEPVTVPVERRVLESRVTTRGDVSFADAVEVVLHTGELDTAAVVTGRIPDEGATIEEGAVLLEVIGRPVIALSGQLPAYRTLSPGVTGPDVAQLEEALARLGLDPGEVDDRYDLDTGRAVAELFQRAGYEPPAVSPHLADQLTAAREAVVLAERALGAAHATLQAASVGPSESERLAAAAAVRSAERALDGARAEGTPDDIAAAEEHLEIVRAQERELVAPRSTAVEQAAVDAAARDLATARQRFGEIEAAVGPPAPAAEIVFLPGLPRRVDRVDTAPGAPVDGPVMVASGADLVVTATVGGAERELLAEGMSAVLDHGDDMTVMGTIAKIDPAPDAPTDFEVHITPEPLDGHQIGRLREANIRVTIPVESTDGEVLAVPLAALFAGPGAESRVEVLDGNGETRLVEVEVGLSADGYAEIRTDDDDVLRAGDRVVVGR